MKICITSQGDNLTSSVESRFGRSPYFIIYDTETANFEAINNPNVAASGGAGIQSAQLIVDKGAKVLLTGQLGDKAVTALAAANIKVVTNAAGTVKETIDKYLAEESGLESVESDYKESETSEGVAATESERSGSWVRRCLRGWTGRGRSGSSGRGAGLGRGRGLAGNTQGVGSSGGRGRGGRGFGGAPEFCVCPKCGEKVAHQRGVPCRNQRCPKCNTVLVRE